MHFNIKSILENNGFNNEKNYYNIYVNLYEAIKKAIATRALEEGFKLPPSRILSKDLQVSRSTVLKAYELLVLEKFVKPVKGSGYYILSVKEKKMKASLGSSFPKGSYPSLSKKGIAFKKNIHIINDESNTSRGIAFRPGLPPLDVFPVQLWRNLTDRYWKNIKPSELSYGNTIGLKCLRENISEYLKLYRNISCDPSQIIITSGSLHSLYLLSTVLIDPDDTVVVENPTYPHAYGLLDSLKANIRKIDVDNEGIKVKRSKIKNPKFVYTTPSNQYPLGVKMSMERRIELIKWASKKNTLIIEDDYDHEFSNWEKPVASLFSIDRQQRVIYLGTFNKLLHPSIRLGYMIVPSHLIDSIIALYEQSSRFVTKSIQKVMSDFIEGDHLNKHLRRVIQISEERKNVFISSFQNNLSEFMFLESPNSGLHLVCNIKSKLQDNFVASQLRKDDIIAHPLSKYYMKNSNKNGLVMGYSSVNSKVIKSKVSKMSNSFDQLRKLM